MTYSFKVNFQCPQDSFCQTWIWFWSYFRIVRGFSHKKISEAVNEHLRDGKSLQLVHAFSSWLADLDSLQQSSEIFE